MVVAHGALKPTFNISNGDAVANHPPETRTAPLVADLFSFLCPALNTWLGLINITVLVAVSVPRINRSVFVLDPHGCNMSSSDVPLWWDKNQDRAGRVIRPDVRAAAHAIWGRACRRAESRICDSSLAADLMESTVAQVSRYLDRGSVPLYSRKIDGLLMLAFRRTVDRHAARLRRLETVGASVDLSIRAVDRTWSRQVDARVELAQIVRLLSGRSRTVLSLRYAGYTWKESAHLLGTSVAALRSAFWRDVTRVKDILTVHSGLESRSQSQERSATTNGQRW